MKYLSKWYLAERSAHKRALAAPMRSTARRCPEADDKAREYATILLARRGIDVAALAAAAKAEFNAPFPPTVHKSKHGSTISDHPSAIPADMEPTVLVEWDNCVAGLRPRFVHFEFSRGAVDGWRQIRAHRYFRFFTFELPHWSYVHPAEAEAA